jgi:transcription elongation GreA/GreB family factor
MSNIPAEGVVGRHTPLGMVLMGSTAGERVVLNIPGQLTKTLEILSIKREPVAAG